MQSQNFPYAISKVDADLHNKMLKDFPINGPKGIVQVGPEKWTLPAKYEQFADQIYNFEARPDDVWICTVPRSGTTWVQEMVWLICNDLDYATALKTPLEERFPYLELNIWFAKTSITNRPTTLTENDFETFKARFAPHYERFSNIKSKRFIKTHLPMKLMPRSVFEVGAKVVYVARNPKDASVSQYHFLKTYNSEGDFNMDFKSFSEYFMKDLALFTPYWKHVLGGWQNRHLDNVHFMFYEDCQNDLASSLKKLADFLGHPLKEEDLPKLMEHLSFESFRKNSSINSGPNPTVRDPKFIRRGLVGGNPEMTPELSEKFDKWMKHNLIGTDFEFPVKV